MILKKEDYPMNLWRVITEFPSISKEIPKN